MKSVEVSLYKCECLAGLLWKAQMWRAEGERTNPEGKMRP